MSDTSGNPERRMWAAVALAAIHYHRHRVHHARPDQPRWVRTDDGSTRLLPRAGEIASARRYFGSADWREVASCAGLDDANVDRCVAIVSTPLAHSVPVVEIDAPTRGRPPTAAPPKPVAPKPLPLRATVIREQNARIKLVVDAVLDALHEGWVTVPVFRQSILDLSWDRKPGDATGARKAHALMAKAWPYAVSLSSTRSKVCVHPNEYSVAALFRSPEARDRVRDMKTKERAAELADIERRIARLKQENKP